MTPERLPARPERRRCRFERSTRPGTATAAAGSQAEFVKVPPDFATHGVLPCMVNLNPYAAVTVNFRPSARTTFNAVSNLGRPSGERALCRLCRPNPVRCAISVSPLSRLPFRRPRQQAERHVGDRQVRNRGRIDGSRSTISCLGRWRRARARRASPGSRSGRSAPAPGTCRYIRVPSGTIARDRPYGSDRRM
jgi:hypothetical protein